MSDWARLKRGDEPRLPKELAEALTLAQELKPEQTANLAVAFADLGRRDTERLRRKSPTDRVVAYFEGILGRPLTRAEKIPIPAILAGDTESVG